MTFSRKVRPAERELPPGFSLSLARVSPSTATVSELDMSRGQGYRDEEDISLVEHIKANTVLYDSTHDRHKDNAFKDHVWREISIKLGKSVNQCKRRWKIIKTSYFKNRNVESGSINKSNNIWLLSYHLSFLDTDQLNLNPPSIGNRENIDTSGKALNYNFLSDDNVSFSSSNKTPHDKESTKEDKIALVLAKGLKEINEMILNCFLKQINILDNTSSTVKIQHEKNNNSNAQNNETTDELAENLNNETADENKLTPTKIKLDNLIFYFSEKCSQSKENNTILQSLQKEVELLNKKSETTKSLGLFFKSVLKDIENVCSRGLNDLKPRIIKCVSDVREMYFYSDVSLGSNACNLIEKSTKSEEENKHIFNFQKKDDMLDHTFETTNSMELFFLSVLADIEDFSIRAIDDVKLRILECVSEVKDIYSYQDVSSVITSNDNTTPNYLQSLSPPTVNLHVSEFPSQEYTTYYNVPFYYNGPTN